MASKMRIVLFMALLIMPISSFAETEFWLEQLTNNASQYTASADLQTSMAFFTNNDFKDCQNQLNLSPTVAAQYFASIPIQLSTNGEPTLLVFPSKYCYSFFGAHSIQFWVVAQKPDKTYSLLLSAREDGIKILTNITNGYSDLKVYYGSDETIYSFNGKSYTKKQNP